MWLVATLSWSHWTIGSIAGQLKCRKGEDSQDTKITLIIWKGNGYMEGLPEWAQWKRRHISCMFNKQTEKDKWQFLLLHSYKLDFSWELLTSSHIRCWMPVLMHLDSAKHLTNYIYLLDYVLCSLSWMILHIKPLLLGFTVCLFLFQVSKQFTEMQ